MYISGSPYNFLNRLHQLPLSGADLNLFVAEGKIYTVSGFFTGAGGQAVRSVWNREYKKKTDIFGYPSGFAPSGSVF